MRVQVSFRPGGFFATDGAVSFTLDGVPFAAGSFLRGVTGARELGPGRYTLEGRIALGLVSRTRTWIVDVPEHDDDGAWLDVRVGYDRVWGSFAKTLDPRVRAADDVADPHAAQAEEDARDGLGDAAPSADAAPAAFSLRKAPATFAVLAVLAGVFALELALPVTPRSAFATPSVPTLVGLGALDAGALDRGEAFRLVAATFLHADPLHLLFNGIALLLVGALVEERLGWRWLLAVYALGGLGGSLVSLRANDGTLVSVGASGAIMGLFAAGLFLAQTLPRAVRGPAQMQLARVLVPSLLPIATRGGGRVDIAAHLGGAMAGALAGLALLSAARRAARVPGGVERFRRSPLALALVVPWLGASAWAAAGVVTKSRPVATAEAAAIDALLPNEDLPAGVPTSEQVHGWLARVPDDPRVRLYASDDALARGDRDEAAAHLAHARASLPRVRSVFSAESFTNLEASVAAAEQRLAVTRRLLPDQEMPRGDDEERTRLVADNLEGWLVRFPDDPRLRSWAASRALERPSPTPETRAAALADAERHARHGLAHVPEVAPLFGPEWSTPSWLDFTLAVVARERGEAPGDHRALCAREDAPGAAARSEGLCPAAAAP